MTNAAVALPAYPNSPELANPAEWRQIEPVEAYDRLEQIADFAESNRIMDTLPASTDEAAASEYAVHAAVVGERLWLLGYLKGNKAAARTLYQRSRDRFMAAVARFQTDAHLTVDRWLGKETWTALQELVSFEGNGLSGRWFATTPPSPALLRACQLRLSVLGLGTRKPGLGFKAPSAKAQDRFGRVLYALRLRESAAFNLDNEANVRLLLDQDRLVAGIAGQAVKHTDGLWRFRLRRLSAWNAARQAELMRTLLVQAAKIELWLLGSEISITGESDYPVIGYGSLRARQKPERHPIGRALLDFYEQAAGHPPDQARELSRRITSEFFRTVATQSDLRADDDISAWNENDGRELANRVASQTDVDSALSQGRSLGLRVWDGIRRIVRWFRKRIKRVLDFGRNLFRLFYRYATKGLQILRRSIHAFVSSVSTWLDGGFDARADWPEVWISMDLDLVSYLHADVSATGCADSGRRLRLFGLRLLYSARVLGVVLSAVINGTLKRWARFARALVSNLRVLIPMYRQIQAAEEHLADA